MTSIENLPENERLALAELKSGIRREFPRLAFSLTLFGSKARGDASPDSDTDVLVDVDIPRISPSKKKRLRRIAGEISLKSGILLCLFVVDRHIHEERGDFSIFQTIREEGIAV